MSDIELSSRWQAYFATIAQAVSSASKDPSTKVGAVIYRPDLSIASTGFNGLPRGIPDSTLNLGDRNRKYPRIVHAEANALDHKRECVHGYGIVVTFQPCSACALKMISNGIKRIYHTASPYGFETRWKDDIKLANELFEEANVKVSLIPPPVVLAWRG